MDGIPSDFGGLLAAWTHPRRALIARFGHGEYQEGIHLTPLNVLQLQKTVEHLVDKGMREGHITDEDVAQADALGAPRPPADVDMDAANRVTGGN